MTHQHSTTDAPRRCPKGTPGIRQSFDPRLSARIDAIIRLETTRPKTISRAWVRAHKRIAERAAPAWFPEVH